jgi:hypothetical protein
LPPELLTLKNTTGRYFLIRFALSGDIFRLIEEYEGILINLGGRRAIILSYILKTFHEFDTLSLVIEISNLCD